MSKSALDEIPTPEQHRANLAKGLRANWERAIANCELRYGLTDQHGTPWRDVYPFGTDPQDIRRSIRPRRVAQPQGAELERLREAAYGRLLSARLALADAEREFADLAGDEAACETIRKRDAAASTWWGRLGFGE